jgi:anti-sigma factor RsiW
MNNHADIRDLLTLAAAGVLDAAGQRRVEEHLRHCQDCRVEFEAWRRLTGALEALPTPQAPLGLVERTRRQMERRAAAQVETRQKRVLLGWLTVFGWVSTLLTWPLFQFLGGVLNLSTPGLNQVWIGYLVVSWMMNAVVTGLLGQRHRQQGRTL